MYPTAVCLLYLSLYFSVHALLTSQLGVSAEQLQDKSACADSDLKADMERWNRTKKRDMKRMLVDMCDRNINYYQQVCDMRDRNINYYQQVCDMCDV